jgi:hypothetical protein
MRGIAQPGRGAERRNFVNARDVFGRERHIDGPNIFFHVFPALGSGDGNNVITLRKQPREGQLGRGAIFGRGNFFNPLHEVEILLEIFTLKSRRIPAVVISFQIFKAPDLSREKSAA